MNPSSPSLPLAAPSPRRDAPVRFLEGFGAVYRWGLRRGFASRRFKTAAVVTVGIGALLGLALSRAPDPAAHLWLHLDVSILSVAVPLIALALAGSGYAEEIQEQTLVYHLVRPISRATVFVARFAAGVLPCVVGAAAVALAVTLGSGVRLSLLSHVEIAAAAALGAAVIGSVYYALGALFQRGLVAGLVYTFVIEGVLWFLPGAVQDLSLIHHVRSLLHRMTDADFASLSAGVKTAVEHRAVRTPGRGQAIDFLVRRATEEWSSAPKALAVLGVVFAIALLVGVRAVKRRDFALKE